MTPRLRSYSFYETRADFVSNFSRFAHWILLAPQAGRFRFQTDNQSGEAAFGDLVLAAPQGQFDRFALEPICYHVLQFDIEKHDAMSLQDGRFPVRETARLRDDFALLSRFAARFDERAQNRIENLLGDLLHLMWESQLDGPPALDPLMRDAARLLREKAGEAFSMRVISDQLGLGAVAFTRRFRACHGENPVEFLTRQRLEIARRLLLETSLSLDEIARQCGYASGFYFSNLWKKHAGLAPGAFRRRHRV